MPIELCLMILEVKSTRTGHWQRAHTYPSFGFLSFGSYWLASYLALKNYYMPMCSLYWLIFKGVVESSLSSPYMVFIWFLSEMYGLRKIFLEISNSAK
jgi:hypothetical protein